MRDNFYLMLEEAKADPGNIQRPGKTLIEPISRKYMPWAGSIAAGLVLLLGGFWIGKQQSYPLECRGSTLKWLPPMNWKHCKGKSNP